MTILYSKLLLGHTVSRFGLIPWVNNMSNRAGEKLTDLKKEEENSGRRMKRGGNQILKIVEGIN